MVEMIWDWKSITSLLATIIFVRTAARDLIPPELHHFLNSLFERLLSSLNPTSTIIIDELDPSGSSNDLFNTVRSYLSSRCLSSAPVIHLSKSMNSKTLISSLPSDHSAMDWFEGVEMKWRYHSVNRGLRSSNAREEPNGNFELTFHSRYKEMVQSRYVQFIIEEAARLELKSREQKLYTNRPFGGNYGSDWSYVPFNHPSTFDTLAIDPTLRDSIRNDLLRFSSRQDYYSHAGRAWKRGYLIYGPPGTGKTSLIAAIANYLDFDLYDLELTAVHSNTQLRKLLVSTPTKSVIVVEDIDCSLDLSNRTATDCFNISEQQQREQANAASPIASLSLSGVLNFIDGLWSSCVGERLMIFTTNHPEKLDPALLRPGRMDKKIHLSYCEMPAFKVLAKNYMEIEEGHKMMEEVEDLLKKVKVTPAEIAEVFMECDGCGADFGMRKVIEELSRREKEMSLLPRTPKEDEITRGRFEVKEGKEEW